jgi:hypothetical protein
LATAARTAVSTASRSTRSPARAASIASSRAASIAASSRGSSPIRPADVRPVSSTHTTRRSRSGRQLRTTTSDRRALARQSIERTSSPMTYSRSASNSVPWPAPAGDDGAVEHAQPRHLLRQQPARLEARVHAQRERRRAGDGRAARCCR